MASINISQFFNKNIRLNLSDGKVQITVLKADGVGSVSLTVNPQTGDVGIIGMAGSENKLNVQGEYSISPDGQVITADSITFGGSIAGVSLGIELTPAGLKANPTDPYAPPIPSANIAVTVGVLRFDYDITIAEGFTMDDVFDQESNGALSSGLLGTAYTDLRHQDRNIDDAVNAAEGGAGSGGIGTGGNTPDAASGGRDGFHGGEQSSSPIILDLDGDGIETTAVLGATHFDFSGDGFAESTGWVGKDDGLLVLDRNGNGTIDDGGELFGNNTVLANGDKAANGFDALQELDNNKDGVIDAQDTIYNELRIWRDLNGDGLSEAGELLTLEQAGVQSINVAYQNSTDVDANGNADKQVGSFTRTDGTTGAATDVWFKVDTMYSVAVDQVDIPDELLDLPNLSGAGFMRDLRSTMALDTSGRLAQAANDEFLLLVA